MPMYEGQITQLSVVLYVPLVIVSNGCELQTSLIPGVNGNSETW